MRPEKYALYFHRVKHQGTINYQVSIKPNATNDSSETETIVMTRAEIDVALFDVQAKFQESTIKNYMLENLVGKLIKKKSREILQTPYIYYFDPDTASKQKHLLPTDERVRLQELVQKNTY